MNELTFNNNHFLKIYTNKNSSIFSKAGSLAYINVVGKIGIIYDDYDYKGCVKDLLKKDNLDKIFINAPRRLTDSIDDKIQFHNIMKESYYTPESYISPDNITDKSSLYFLKKKHSSGGKGVWIYNFDDLSKVDTTDCVIQKNISNPDLYRNKRYKIRQLVLLYENKVYLHKNSFFTVSDINYDSISSNNLRDIFIISQKHNTVFELSNKLENFNLIFENITLAVKDFTRYYHDKINTINGNNYVVLGLDIIVSSDKKVQIIEINHRSNYLHPSNVSLDCDVDFFKNMILLFTKNEIDNLILIN